jgi:hypothetical protein
MFSSTVTIKTTIEQFTKDMLDAVDVEVEEIGREYRRRLLVELQSIKHGKRYKSKHAAGATAYHTASAPGESPANLSGDLAGSIKISRDDASNRDYLEVSIYSDSLYALELEIGGRHYAARPMWIPVAQAIQDEFIQACTTALLMAAAKNDI